MQNHIPELVFLSIYVALVLVMIALVVISIYRARMAPRVRKAMNTAYDKVEFLRLNHVPEFCDGESLHRLDFAVKSFADARRALNSSRYKRCLELANQAVAQIDNLRSRLFIREIPMPVPPSCRIISHPDYLIWMGK